MQHWKAAKHQCPARGSILCADAAAALAPAPTYWRRDCDPDSRLHNPHALSQAAALPLTLHTLIMSCPWCLTKYCVHDMFEDFGIHSPLGP